MDMHDLAGQETEMGEERVVVAGRKAPTVTAQTERRDRKVVAAVTALARQKSMSGSSVSDGLAVTWHSLSYTFPPSRVSVCLFDKPTGSYNAVIRAAAKITKLPSSFLM